MYKRNTRSAVKRISVPLGPLRLDVGPHDAPDGTLAECLNMRPAGPTARPYYTPIVPQLFQTKALGTVVALGTYSFDSVTRVVSVTTIGVYVYPQDSPSSAVLVYTFDSVSATRKAQFAEVAGRLYIATSTGAFPETPEHLLSYDGADCRKVYFPETPHIDATTATDISDGGLNGAVSPYPAIYGYRWAYELKGGVVGPPSRPVFFAVGTPSNDGWQITFQLADYPDNDNPLGSTYWGEEITGIVIYISSAVLNSGITVFDEMANVPYYRAVTMANPAEHSTYGTSVIWSGTDAQLIANETLEDENLWQHAIEASAVYGYNQELLLGDAQYNFRKPHALTTFLGSTKIRDLATDYAVRLGVTIKTQKGTYQRISDPVYVPAGSASTTKARGVFVFGSTWADGLLMYPDSRATQFQVYVDSNNDGAFSLLGTYNASKAGNLSYNQTTTIDLTGAVTTAMPDLDTVQATRDRDPNRMLRSDTFAPMLVRASKALYTASRDSDAIIAFESNTLPVSDGQYGTSPIIVFGHETVRAFIYDDLGALVNTVPLSNRGVVSRYGVTNGTGTIFMVASDGVWTFTPQQGVEPISTPVHSWEAEADILSEIGSNTSIAYVDDGRGNKDIWIATGVRVWVFSITYGRWFNVDRVFSVLAEFRNKLYSFNPAQSEVSEQVSHPNDGIGSPTSESFRLVTRPMVLNSEPGQIKRIYRVGIRQRVGLDYLAYAIFDPIDSSEGAELIDAKLESEGTGVVYAISTTITTPTTVVRFADVPALGEFEVTGNYLEVIPGAYTIPEYERLVARGSLEVDILDADELIVEGDLYVVGDTQGALIAAGTLVASKTDIEGHDAALCRDAYIVLSGRGKMGQGLESIDFDVEARMNHRPRKRNY